MRPFTALLLLALVFRVAEGRRGTKIKHQKSRGHRRSNSINRFVNNCKEYFEDGDKFLDCQDRHLTAVLLGWPEDIDHLLLAQNKIKVLRDNTFSHFRNLESLDLQLNEISLIEEGAFSGLSKLTTLLLQYNRLQMITEAVLIPMPRLRYLRLHDNPWRCDCELDSFVHFLQVPSNRNMGNYAKCTEPTELWGQKVKTLDAKLLCVPHMQKPPLCIRYGFSKPLLDCRSKGLQAVPASAENIIKLDLSFNNITKLGSKEFVTSKDLKLLNLSSNSLQHINTAAFAGLLYLQELDLSNNSLHYFNYGVLEDLYYLRTLSLGGNPWICDYNIHYLIYWLQHHPAVEHTGLVCSEPEEFRDWPVESYVKTYNDECPKDKQVDQHTGNDPEMTTSQELIAEFDEDPGLLPANLRAKHPVFDIFHLLKKKKKKL
ncbi:leucine-rich repeat-containing protein 17 [Trichomycterus rosablanca]|uniref:leucine-rich repeat-containing protein 17 n=1 Tax=Trichomycterus rosablanca TaxID=2290929 RepID=UPI002F359735